MPRELTSAGILLASNNYYLLGCPSHRTGTTGGWGILKGRTDETDENLLATALREFYEESSLRLDTMDNLVIERDPFYSYHVEGKDRIGKFLKTVYVFRAYDDTATLYERDDNLKC